MSLIGKEIQDFKTQAFIKDEFKEITKQDLLGKWNVFFFYPADFTFVCPTELEDLAKSGTKNQLVLWYPHNLYTWNEFEKNVEASKLPFLDTIYKAKDSISFMYNLLRFLTNVRENDGINLARFAYTLARSNLNHDQIHQLYDWSVSTKDRKELITAMEILIYSNREEV